MNQAASLPQQFHMSPTAVPFFCAEHEYLQLKVRVPVKKTVDGVFVLWIYIANDLQCEF